MEIKIEEVYLSIERLQSGAIDYDNENTDVIIRDDQGDIYVAAFFTYSNLQQLIEIHRENGAFLGGKFFWVEGLVLIDNCSEENVMEVVQYLLEEGDFERAFRKL